MKDENKTKKISTKVGITGAHSSGKTTRIEFITEVCKLMRYPYIIVPESARRAKEVGLDINKEADYKVQKWIMDDQIVNELDAEQDSRYNTLILCDRTVWDVVVYSSFALQRDMLTLPQYNILEGQARQHAVLSPYDKIYLCKPRPMIDDGIRDTDVEWQRQLFERFEYYFAINGIRYELLR